MPDDTQPNSTPESTPTPTPTPTPDLSPTPDVTPSPTPTPTPSPSFTPPSPTEPTPFSPAPAQPGLSDPTPSPFGSVPPVQSAPFGSQTVDQPAGAPTPDLIPQAPKSNKKLIGIIVGIVVLLIAGAVAAYLLLQPGGFKALNNSGGETAADIAPAEKNEITATKISEFSEVCNGKKIANAPEVTKPVKTVPYIDLIGDWSIFLYSLKENDRLTTTMSEAAVVACAQPDESTATAAKACQPTNFSTQETYDLEYKGVTFDLTFYAAKTGEIISSTKITSTNDVCPVYATKGGSAYAMPTEDVVTPAFEAFFAAN